MSVAYLDVSAELIRQVLKLPDDCEVIAGSGDTECGVVRLLVDHASIPQDAIVANALAGSFCLNFIAAAGVWYAIGSARKPG